MIESKKLPSTLLFNGPKGVGKASFAYRTIRYLLAKESERPPALFGPSSFEIEPETATFSRIASEAHSDLLILEPEVDAKTGIQKQDIKVDAARKVGSFLSLTPAESDWRVVLIDSACTLNISAANALLKLIEEPPKNALMILLSHNSGALLPTIRSRCHQVTFSTPNENDFISIMKMHGSEGAESELAAYYQLAYGSPGFAVTLMQNNAAEHYQNLLNQLAQQGGPLFAMEFAESITQKKGGIGWDIWQHLYSLLFQRALRAYEQALPKEVIHGEQEILSKLTAAKGPSFLIDVAEKIQHQLTVTQNLHLDKKQTMLQSIHAMN